MALDIKQFLSRPMPEERWIIDQLLPLNGGLMLYGPPKLGKTLLTLGMGLAISDGHPSFLGLDVPIHGRVLFVQVDMPVPLFDTYVRKVSKTNSFENAYFIDRWEIPDRSLNLLKPKHVDWLKGQVDKVQPMVVFLDTLRSLHSSNENDPTEMSNLYERILSALGSSALVILHHARKPGLYSSIVDDARGATSVAGRVDVIAQLSGSAKKVKLKYSTRAENTNPDGIELRQNRSGLFEVVLPPKQLVETLREEHPGITAKELAALLIEGGVKKSTAYRLVN